MTDDETVLGAMRMFEDLDAFNLFKIPKEVTFLSRIESTVLSNFDMMHFYSDC